MYNALAVLSPGHQQFGRQADTNIAHDDGGEFLLGHLGHDADFRWTMSRRTARCGVHLLLEILLLCSDGAARIGRGDSDLV